MINFFNNVKNKCRRKIVNRSFSLLIILLSVLSLSFFYSPEAVSDSLLNEKPEINSSVTVSILKVTVGLALVIVAIFSSAWFYRRFGNFSPVANDALKVIGGISLGQKEKIILLQVGEEQLLVGVAPGNIQKIHIMKTPIKVSEKLPNERGAFANQLSDAMKKWKNK